MAQASQADLVYLRQDSDGLAQINQYLDTSEGAASMFSAPADVGYHREPAANTLSHATESGADTSLNPMANTRLGDANNPSNELIGDSPIGAGSALTISQNITLDGGAVAGEAQAILFVDSRLPDYQQVVAAAHNDVRVVILNTESDGIKQIADVLKNYHNLDSVSIVSHGDEGVLLLGSAVLSSNDLALYQNELHTIGAALAPQGKSSSMAVGLVPIASGRTFGGFGQCHRCSDCGIHR